MKRPKPTYVPLAPISRADWVPRFNIYACLCGYRHEGDKAPCELCGDQMQLIQAAGSVA